MSGPINGGGGAGGGAVTPTPSGPIGGHLNRLIGSVSPPRAAGGRSTKTTTSRSAGKPGKPKSASKPGKRRGGK